MGLVNWARNKHLKDPVAGSYTLTSASVGAPDASYSNCSMHGVLTAPGLAAVAVAHKCMAPTRKWPQPGQVLPVLFERSDPTRLHVQWDDMVRSSDLGQQLAEQQAALLNGTPVAAVPVTGSTAGSTAGSAQVTTQVSPGVTVRVSVMGDPGRPVPGAAGGGLTPEQSAQVAADGGASLGLQAATATVLAVHDVPVPPGTPGVGGGGFADLTLDIDLPGAAGFSTSMRLGFSTPTRRAAIAAVGRTLPVLVNPAHRDQVAIDVTRLGPLPD